MAPFFGDVTRRGAVPVRPSLSSQWTRFGVSFFLARKGERWTSIEFEGRPVDEREGERLTKAITAVASGQRERNDEKRGAHLHKMVTRIRRWPSDWRRMWPSGGGASAAGGFRLVPANKWMARV